MTAEDMGGCDNSWPEWSDMDRREKCVYVFGILAITFGVFCLVSGTYLYSVYGLQYPGSWLTLLSCGSIGTMFGIFLVKIIRRQHS